jgi:hypothetical protein
VIDIASEDRQRDSIRKRRTTAATLVVDAKAATTEGIGVVGRLPIHTSTTFTASLVSVVWD